MRTIDADALTEELYDLKYTKECPSIILTPAGQEIYNSGIESAIGTVLDAPTIDPVKHAKWLPRKPGDVHACSSCGFGVLVSMWFKNGMGIGPRISHNKFRYCPYCGAMMSNAKMDGVPHDDSGQ